MRGTTVECTEQLCRGRQRAVSPGGERRTFRCRVARCSDGRCQPR